MNRTLVAALFAASTLVTVLPATAGPLDPDCTAEKAAKSAATKAAVGVGGRCSPAEAAKDATGIGDGDRKKPLSGDRDRKKEKVDDNANKRNNNKD